LWIHAHQFTKSISLKQVDICISEVMISSCQVLPFKGILFFSILVHWGSVIASEPTCICANHLTSLITVISYFPISQYIVSHTQWLEHETETIITTDWWTLNYVQHSSCVWYYSKQNFMNNASPQVYYILPACIYLLNVPPTLIN